MMDLKPYTAKGFPGKIDEALANVPVKGIDADQAQTMVRLCPQTEATLYGPEFSATKIRYRKGSRPALEKIVAGFTAPSPTQRAIQAMHWVAVTVKHPHVVGPTPPDRNFTEEQLIESKVGWCNEQSRVFAALCQVMEIPARIYFVTHEHTRSGHTCAEAFLDGRWVFFDVTFDLVFRLPNGTLAQGRDFSAAPNRQVAHEAYRPKLQAHYQRIHPFVENFPGWNKNDRPAAEAGGDLLTHIGVTNYLIEGVSAA